jgi:hypothetical protein
MPKLVHRAVAWVMHRFVVIAILGISCGSSFSQSLNVAPKIAKSPSDAEVLLTKTKALYDTPFRSGLLSFSCSIDFDFARYLQGNFGEAARTDSPIAQLLEPIKYRVFVDHSGATISSQTKLPEFSQLPIAAQLEESNRSLIQTELSNWVPDYGQHSTEHDQVPRIGKKLEPKAEVAIVGLCRDKSQQTESNFLICQTRFRLSKSPCLLNRQIVGSRMDRRTCGCCDQDL